MEYLSKLFGSPTRVKLLRLFMFNLENVYGRDDVVEISRITPSAASKELAALTRAGLIRRKTFYKEVRRPGSRGLKKRKTLGYVFDPKFPYVDALTRFLANTITIVDSEVRKRFKGVGTVRLLILSGFLIGNEESMLDMLIVGSALNESAVHNAVRHVEAECGREIRYTILSNDEYEYRARARDKLIRDVFDSPHRVLVDKG